MIEIRLPPNRTHGEDRSAAFFPVAAELCMGYLVVSQGRVGPRGGTSKMTRDGYFVQLVEQDPDYPDIPPTWHEFLLTHDHTEKADVYKVLVPPRGTRGNCTCQGFVMQGTCKHIDCIYFLVFSEGVCDGLQGRDSEPIPGRESGHDPAAELAGHDATR